MRRRMSLVVPLLMMAAFTGCYHAIVETGRTPNGQVIENEWAHSFIGGLIPPSVVETASQCPNGVARVETQHSLLNMLAASLTWGLYSPMTITVSCAGPTALDTSRATLQVADASTAERSLARAVQLAKSSGEPVFVHFTE
jgi:hypothetical protein